MAIFLTTMEHIIRVGYLYLSGVHAFWCTVKLCWTCAHNYQIIISICEGNKKVEISNKHSGGLINFQTKSIS